MGFLTQYRSVPDQNITASSNSPIPYRATRARCRSGLRRLAFLWLNIARLYATCVSPAGLTWVADRRQVDSWRRSRSRIVAQFGLLVVPALFDNKSGSAASCALLTYISCALLRVRSLPGPNAHSARLKAFIYA